MKTTFVCRQSHLTAVIHHKRAYDRRSVASTWGQAAMFTGGNWSQCGATLTVEADSPTGAAIEANRRGWQTDAVHLGPTTRRDVCPGCSGGDGRPRYSDEAERPAALTGYTPWPPLRQGDLLTDVPGALFDLRFR